MNALLAAPSRAFDETALLTHKLAVSLSGVIFDFDGVIANSEPLHLRAYQEVLALRGITLESSHYYDRYLGYDDVGVFRAMSRDQQWDLSDETLAELIRVKGECFDTLVTQGDALFSGAAECIRRTAATVPIAIASGALAEEIESLLVTADLREYFRAIVASGDTPRSKPAPDPYLRATELLRPHAVTAGLDPQGCFVAIEDSRWGIESALRAGLPCVGVAQTYAADELDTAHSVVATIADVTLDTLQGACQSS